MFTLNILLSCWISRLTVIRFSVYRCYLFSVFCYRICSGYCYVYTLSIRESKKTKHNGCTCESERTFSDYSSISYHRDEGDKRKIWPKRPDSEDEEPIYKRIFIAEEKSPHCIYALVHKGFVPASSLSIQDNHKFRRYDVYNAAIFTDFERKKTRKKETIDELKKQLCLGSVLPKQYVVDRLDSFQRELSDVVAQNGATAEERVENLEKLFKKFMDGVESRALQVKEGRQLNVWLNELLGKIINDNGFKVKKHLIDNRYSIFGSSQPDLAFIKIHQGAILGAVIHVVDQGDETEQSMEQCNVFDCDTEKSEPQCFANMISLANDRVIELLEGGTLVDSVTVYGLILMHSHYEKSVPMKYYSNFDSDPVILVGYPANFAELLFCILQC